MPHVPRGYLTVTLSCVYAVFIVTLGVVIYVSDIVLRNGTPLAEVRSGHICDLLAVFLVSWFWVRLSPLDTLVTI
jgi:hypothetical protein